MASKGQAKAGGAESSAATSIVGAKRRTRSSQAADADKTTGVASEINEAISTGADEKLDAVEQLSKRRRTATPAAAAASSSASSSSSSSAAAAAFSSASSAAESAASSVPPAVVPVPRSGSVFVFGAPPPAAPAPVVLSGDPLSFFSRSSDPVARVLSNFSPSWLLVDGRWYPTVEHLYQADKFRCSNLPSAAADFSSAARGAKPAVGLDPKLAKSAGCKGGMKKRGATLNVVEWEAASIRSMRAALALKFADPASPATTALRSTGQRPLIHFERRAGLWGQSTSATNGAVTGLNLLGRMLQDIRAKLPPFPPAPSWRTTAAAAAAAVGPAAAK